MTILTNIDSLIIETDELYPVNESLGVLLTLLITKVSPLIKYAKNAGVLIIDPKTAKFNDSFKEEVRATFIIAIKSIAISTAINQVLNMLFTNVNQSDLNKLHIRVAVELFSSSVVLVVVRNVINKMLINRGGEPLTRNQLGIVATLCLGFCLFTFMQTMEHSNIDLPQSNIVSIFSSMFLTFIINTTYISDLVRSVTNMIFNTRNKKPHPRLT